MLKKLYNNKKGDKHGAITFTVSHSDQWKIVPDGWKNGKISGAAILE